MAVVGALGGTTYNEKLFLLHIFSIYCGNIAHTIASATLLYEYTGSVTSFGVFLTGQIVVNFSLNLIAGSVVDRFSSKKFAFTVAAFSGVVILGAFILLQLGTDSWVIIVAMTCVAIIKPFHRSSIFSLLPSLTCKDRLPKINSLQSIAVQLGLLLGAVVVGVIIHYFSSLAAFSINGFAFIFASLVLVPVKLGHEINFGSRQSFSLIDDWRIMYRLIRTYPSLAFHIIIASADFTIVSYIDFFIVPLSKSLNESAVQASVINGGFTVGGIVSGIFAANRLGSWNPRITIVITSLMQAVAFAIMSHKNFLLLYLLMMFAIGAANTISISMLTSTLQARCSDNIRGRVSALVRLGSAIVGVIFIPLVTLVLDRFGLELSLWTAGITLLIFPLGIIILGSKYFFGETLFDENCFLNEEEF